MARHCFLFGFVLSLFFGSVNAEDLNKHTIRGTHWGMTLAEVKAIEKWEYMGMVGNFAAYAGELVKGTKTNLLYEFDGDLLVSLAYIIESANKNTYLLFQELLVKKYGSFIREITEQDLKTQAKMLKEYNLDVEGYKPVNVTFTEWVIFKKTTRVKLIYSSKKKALTIQYGHKEYQDKKAQLKEQRKKDHSSVDSNDL